MLVQAFESLIVEKIISFGTSLTAALLLPGPQKASHMAETKHATFILPLFIHSSHPYHSQLPGPACVLTPVSRMDNPVWPSQKLPIYYICE